MRKSPQIAVLHSLFAGSRKLEHWRTNKQKCRPIRCIKVENCAFQVLVDTGPTHNVMDECTFRQLLADKVTLKTWSSVLIGKFDAMVESGKIPCRKGAHQH